MRKATERGLTIAVNPGSTSTKLAIYRGEQCLACETIDHKKEELAQFACVANQFLLYPEMEEMCALAAAGQAAGTIKVQEYR